MQSSVPVRIALATLAVLGSTGCIGHRVVHPIMPTGPELAEFEAAGPPVEQIDTDELVAMHIGREYELVAGDLVKVKLPASVTGSVEDESEPTVEIDSRVGRDGTVRLPLLGDFPLVGLTIEAAEQAIANAYHPQYLVDEKPNVVVTIEDYKTAAVAVMGAVNTPGIHALRSDRLSVLGALMAAGGIHPDRGASAIRILRPSEDGDTDAEVLPVRMTDIPLQDILLTGGETIVVEPQAERTFAVIGLVKKSGIFPYPEPRQFNLLQVIATAGGVDDVAAPRFATVYRKKESGEIIAATFRLDGLQLFSGSNIQIKDGDVVAIEHTEGSWLRSFVSSVFGFRASFSASGATTTTL